MKNIFLTIFTASSLAISAFGTDFYFTQGTEGATPYTRNWSDLNNWSTVEVSSSTSDVGKKWNTSPATSTVTGVGSKIYVGYYSAFNGTTLGTLTERYVNVDVQDIVISYLEFQNRSNVADHVKGEKLTFEGALGSETIVQKNRTYGASIVDNDIQLNTTSTGAINYKIKNTTNENLVFNGKFTVNGTFNSSSYEPLYAYCQTSNTSTFAKGNIQFNNQMTLERCLVVDVTSTSDKYVVSKVYIQGEGDNTMTLKVRNGGIAVLNKTSGARAATSYEIYMGGIVEVMSSGQITSAQNIKSTGVLTTTNNLSGSLLLHGNSTEVGNISITPNSSVLADAKITQLFKVDYGEENIGTERDFFFKKLTVDSSNNKIDKTTSGLLLANFQEGTDKIYCVTTDAAAGAYSDNIFFDGYGIKGVDYIVMSQYDSENGRWNYYMAVPEPATIAAFFALSALAVAALRRRK